MIMREDQSQRFLKCIDTLTVFANEQLNLEDNLFESDGVTFNDEARYNVLNALFTEHLEIIDKYVEANEYDLLESTLNEVKSWKCAVCSKFLLVDDTEDYALMSFKNYTFGVVGITDDIKNVVRRIPDMYTTILLPFEGLITYAMTFMGYDIDYGDGLKEMMKKECEKARKREVIYDAEDFRQIAPVLRYEIEEDDRERKKEIKAHQEWSKTNHYVVPSEGKHESPLKGLPFKEREKAILEHDKKESFDILDKSFEEICLKQAKEYFIKSAPVDSVAEFNKIAKGKDKAPEPDITLSIMDTYLKYARPEFYAVVKDVIDCGFSKTLSKKEMRSIFYTNPDILNPFGKPFYHNDSFQLQIFKEYHDVLKNYDWQWTEKFRESVRNVVHACDALSYLCGVVSIEDAYKQFCEWYKDDKHVQSFDDFFEILNEIYDLDLWELDFNLIDTFDYDGMFIVDAEITDKYHVFDEDDDISDDEFEKNAEKFNEEVSSLLQHREDVNFRPFPIALKDMDVVDFCRSFPQTEALTEFFDERVPDGGDDYNYTDDVIFDLINIFRRCPATASNITLFLEEHDFDFDADELQEFLNRFIKFVNALPKWINYGMVE